MPTVRVNGTDLFYVEVGTGHPCLVMHGGLGFDHTLFRPWLDPLGDTLRMIYYDHRGNGRSGRPPLNTLTFEQFVEDADSLRSYLGLDRAAIFGHSFGSFIALEYALRHPARVSHLLLSAAGPAWDYGDEILGNARRKGATPDMLALLDLEACREDQYLRKAMRTLAPLYFYKFDQSIFDRLFEHVIFSGAATGRGGELLRNYDITGRLWEITPPTLILSGEDDYIHPPSQARRLHRGIPDSTLIIFEESGHFSYVERNDSFLKSVRNWLHRTGVDPL